MSEAILPSSIAGRRDRSIAMFQGVRNTGQRADEPYESRDLELGDVLCSWAEAHTASLSAELEGPLDAPGMDPTWILRVHGRLLDAEVHLFYGPIVNASLFLPQQADDGMYVGGESGVTARRLLEMLDGLEEVSRGGTMPLWLRAMPS